MLDSSCFPYKPDCCNVGIPPRKLVVGDKIAYPGKPDAFSRQAPKFRHRKTPLLIFHTTNLVLGWLLAEIQRIVSQWRNQQSQSA